MEKKVRKIFSFEPEPDVLKMLERAKEAGLTQGEILNEALRDCGPKVIKRIAVKKASSLATLSSFDVPERQTARELIAA